MSDPTLPKLRAILLSEFTEAELAELCKQIGLHYDALPGTGRFGKTREIIEAARAQGKLRLLQIKLRELRPVAYAAIDLPLPDPPTLGQSQDRSRSNRQSQPRSPAPAIAVVLVVIAVALLLVTVLMPRQGTLPAGGEAPSVVPVPTSPPSPEPTAEELPTPTPEPSPTPTRAELPVVVVQPSATPEPAPAEPAISETRVPTEAQPVAHPAVQTIRDANEELVALFTGRKDAAALQPLWMPSALDLLIGFATVRLPRAMRVSADQRDTIQASYEYLRAPALVDERGNTAVVTSREYWQFSTTVNNVVICETRDYTYTLVVEGDGYRIRTFSGRLLSTRCR